eukprot:6423136-Amphidinium_carterae.1
MYASADIDEQQWTSIGTCRGARSCVLLYLPLSFLQMIGPSLSNKEAIFGKTRVSNNPLQTAARSRETLINKRPCRPVL